jgi:hypothetical protein
VGAVLLGAAGRDDDGGSAGFEEIADFGPGELFEEDGVGEGEEEGALGWSLI